MLIHDDHVQHFAEDSYNITLNPWFHMLLRLGELVSDMSTVLVSEAVYMFLV